MSFAGGATEEGVRAERTTRRERREQTRAALLEAAERLWAERGIHGASLDDVASAAGLTKGAVYSNFAGKTDLLLALVEHCTRERVGTETCAELGDTSRPPKERYERAGLAFRRRLEGDQARLTALLLVEFWLFGMRDYAAGWRIADWYAECRDHLASGLPEPSGASTSDGPPPSDRQPATDGQPASDRQPEPDGVSKSDGQPEPDGEPESDGVSRDDRAALALALDTGLALQHLLDPTRVPADLYGTGMRLLLGD
ncbi:TetR family transcriptional regulator [Actinomadura logoneensis]|uniref:TetR family transcriptional regulator n=1 Tax=Actinomadura logoneensis TaxID=2293572 RepID=UPI001F474548|nr:TetR family transcriptional regulator [Actinomadura logoneensis]